MDRRWIVTGANGYLGGEICKGLQRAGLHPVAFARAGRQPGDLQAAGIPCHAYEELPSVISKGDRVVHCAGKVGETGAWEDYVQTNVQWSAELFDQAAAAGADCFVYVSSIAALGYKNRAGAAVLDETSTPDLVDGELYGRSKLLAEQTLSERAEKTSTRLVVLRPGLIYGRRRFGSCQSWLRRGITVDRRQRVPLVHVDNLIDAVVSTGGQALARGVFIVVDDEQPELSELNALKLRHGLLRYRPWPVGMAGFRLQRLLHVTAAILRGRPPMPAAHAAAQVLMRTRRMTYSTKKLREQTGWQPAINLAAGLRECATATEPVVTENA